MPRAAQSLPSTAEYAVYVVLRCKEDVDHDVDMVSFATIPKGAFTRVPSKEGTFQMAEGKVRQIQKSLSKFELSRFLASAAWKLASWLGKIKCAKFKLI